MCREQPESSFGGVRSSCADGTWTCRTGWRPVGCLNDAEKVCDVNEEEGASE